MNRVLKPQSANQSYVKKKLLHFGADWITFNISPADSGNIPISIKFLDQLFALPHNDTNASEYDDFIWAKTNNEVLLQFTGSIQMGEVLMVKSHKGKTILSIVLVDDEWRKNINYKHKYRINCYGTLFDYDRLGILDAKSFLQIFIEDILSNALRHSISRVDICSDLANYKVSSIQRGVIGSKAHMKSKTVINLDNPETFNYGKKDSKWMARAYNKLLETQQKKKEWIYLKYGYFDYPTVTRLEVEAKSDICLENCLTLPLCFDGEYLFGVYKALLYAKFVKFQVIPFIESELKRTCFKIITPTKREHDSKTLAKMPYLKRCASFCESAMDRYDLTFDKLAVELQNIIKPEMGISLNQDDLITKQDIRKVFNIK